MAQPEASLSSDEKEIKQDPKEEPIDEFSLIPFDNQISTLAVVGDEMAIKEEPLFNNDVKEEPVDEYESILCDTQEFGSDFVREEMFFKEDEHRNDDMNSPEAAEEEKISRPKRKSSKCLKYDHAMEQSEEDVEPSEWESKSTKKVSQSGAKKRTSSCINNQSKSVTKNSRPSRLAKTNDTDLECLECDFRTRSVNALSIHLRKKHNTTPALAGLALRCECGHESTSHSHMYSCDVANFTVVRKREGPIRRITDAKTTPKCVLCEIYPKTSFGYACHLIRHHKSNLNVNGLYLLCSCGLEVRYYQSDPNHSKKCNGRDFTLHKLDES